MVILTFTLILSLQVVHATVVKQLEIAELLENLRESGYQVSRFT